MAAFAPLAEKPEKPGGPMLSRKCACASEAPCSKCSEPRNERLHRSGAGPAHAGYPEAVSRVLASPGVPLSPGLRSLFEPRFGELLSRGERLRAPGMLQGKGGISSPEDA